MAEEDYLKLAVMLHEGREIIVRVEVLAPGKERCCPCVLLLFCLLHAGLIETHCCPDDPDSAIQLQPDDRDDGPRARRVWQDFKV